MPHSHIRVITVFRSLRDESPTPRDLDKQEAVPVLQIGPVASSVKLPRLGTFGAGGFVVSCSPYIFSLVILCYFFLFSRPPCFEVLEYVRSLFGSVRAWSDRDWCRGQSDAGTLTLAVLCLPWSTNPQSLSTKSYIVPHMDKISYTMGELTQAKKLNHCSTICLDHRIVLLRAGPCNIANLHRNAISEAIPGWDGE